MKTKKIFLLGILIFIGSTINAQVKFGIKEGINLCTQSELGLIWDNNDMKTGITLGAIADYRFHETLSLQVEANYNLAKTDKERMKRLFDSQSITQKQWDDVQDLLLRKLSIMPQKKMYRK